MDKIKYKKCIGYSDMFTHTYTLNIWDDGRINYSVVNNANRGVTHSNVLPVVTNTSEPISVAQTVEVLQHIDADKYRIPLRVADTVRQACRRGRIKDTKKTLTGGWMIDLVSLIKWATNEDMHKRGPKKSK